MKKLLIVLVAIAIPFSAAYACSAFLQDEYVDGMSRVCIYDHLGSDYVITIRSTQICRVTVQVRH